MRLRLVQDAPSQWETSEFLTAVVQVADVESQHTIFQVRSLEEDGCNVTVALSPRNQQLQDRSEYKSLNHES